MSVLGIGGLVRVGLQIVQGEIADALDALQRREEEAWQGNMRGRTIYVVTDRRNDYRVVAFSSDSAASRSAGIGSPFQARQGLTISGLNVFSS